MPSVHAPGAVLADGVTPDEARGAAASPTARDERDVPRWRLLLGRPWILIALLVAVIGLPLVVAVIALHGTRWFPVLDLAMTEVRVRDVGGAHTPLIGLPGRIGTLAQQGSHPGPLSFYALAPAYRLFGSSSWALQAATAALNLVAVSVSLVLAHRRGGTRLLLAVAVVLAFLVRGYGVGTLTEPWNPYLPLLWWVVVLLAAWSVVCGDFVVLPVAVFAASFCAQTHLPYLGLSLGLGALAVDARNAKPPAPGLSSVLADLMPKTEQALLDHQGTATGRDGRYSVTWSDALYIGSQGYGIVLELERQGFTAGVPSYARVPMTTHRVVEPADATAVIHLSTGFKVDEWRAKPGAVEVGFIDPRSPEQQAEFARLRGEAIQMLHAAGLDDIVPHVDDNLFGAAIDDRLTTPENQLIQERLQRMLDLGLPTAIFLAPPGTEN